MFLFHGVPKLMGGPELWSQVGKAMTYLGIDFGYTFWGFMAGFSESVGGILLLLGFFTRPACMMLTFTMFVAATRHLSQGDGILGASHAIEDGIVFLSLILIGPGIYSLDSWIHRRRTG